MASTSQVTPLQAISIPGLELMATVAGLKLEKTIGRVLGTDKHKLVFWFDSMDVPSWIRGQSRKFKPFVANHEEIQTEIILWANCYEPG